MVEIEDDKMTIRCKACNGTGVDFSSDDIGDGTIGTYSNCQKCDGKGVLLKKMNESINLTEDLINITKNEYGYFVSVFFCKFDKEKAKQLKQQILDDREKAEKWNNASNSKKYNICNDDKDGYCVFEKEVNDLHQKNKQLQDKISLIEKTWISDVMYDILEKLYYDARKENINLKKKLSNRNVKHLQVKDLERLKEYRILYLKNKNIVNKVKARLDILEKSFNKLSSENKDKKITIHLEDEIESLKEILKDKSH